MATIPFDDIDIKKCKTALVNQHLTSFQSAVLMQHINNLEHDCKFLYSKLKQAKHFLDSHATDFDDGRWNLELSELELQELEKIITVEKR